MYQVIYHDGEQLINETWEGKNLSAIKRRLSKIEIMGNAQIYDKKLNKVFYYKPRFK